jgi:hypothetical protein
VDIRRIAARYRLGELPGEELPDIAIDLLNEGHDAQALRVLAGLDRPTLRDAGDLFESVLGELGVSLPDLRAAKLLTLEYYLHQIVAGEVDTGNGAYAVWWLADDLFEHGELEAWIPFVGLASEYEDHPPLRAELAAEIVALAREALDRLREPST